MIDVGVDALETRFLGFILAKKRVVRVLSNLANGKLSRHGLIDNSGIHSKIKPLLMAAVSIPP